MTATDSRTLVAVLSNPPLTDGHRTLRRVDLAAELLGFTHRRVANLFALPSHATGAIADLGQENTGWDQARADLTDHLAAADAVLLAYGCTAPAGEARHHFRRQVDWLLDHSVAATVPTWCVGDGPRHPSRWQRWTSRTHPDLAFPDALRQSLTRLDLTVPWIELTLTPRTPAAPPSTATPEKDH
nr:DUF1643 domain-containing protein [Propionibacterium sp.]